MEKNNFTDVVMNNANKICSLVTNPLWDVDVIESIDGITICAKVIKGVRVLIHNDKKYGTITGACEWRNKLSYCVLADGIPDIYILRPEDFTVLESDK